MTSLADKFLNDGPIAAYPSTRIAAKELDIFSDKVEIDTHMPPKTRLQSTLKKNPSSKVRVGNEAEAR